MADEHANPNPNPNLNPNPKGLPWPLARDPERRRDALVPAPHAGRRVVRALSAPVPPATHLPLPERRCARLLLRPLLPGPNPSPNPNPNPKPNPNPSPSPNQAACYTRTLPLRSAVGALLRRVAERGDGSVAAAETAAQALGFSKGGFSAWAKARDFDSVQDGGHLPNRSVTGLPRASLLTKQRRAAAANVSAIVVRAKYRDELELAVQLTLTLTLTLTLNLTLTPTLTLTLTR